MPQQHPLAESVSLAEAAGGATPKGRRFRARLIAGDIQGSSGYYPAITLRESAPVFSQGLPMYIDHPTVSEAYERPERSVRDRAGRLASPAVYEGDGLYADVEVYPHWAPIIEAMADDIGLSIRASGTVEASTADGIRGPIVTRITEAQSVDFVTAAGAGGRLVQLIESARAQALEERGDWREDKHPRGYHGRFGHGSSGPHTGGGGGEHSAGGGTRTASVKTNGGGSITVSRHADGAGTLQVGADTHKLSSEDYKQLHHGMGILAHSPLRSTPVGGELPITSGDRTLAIVKRTGKSDFQLHMSPRPDASRDDIAATPGTALTRSDARGIYDTMGAHERAAADEDQAARNAARQANIDAGRTDDADITRRAAGKPPTTAGPGGKGMPSTIASADVKTTNSGTVSVHREAGDDFTHMSVSDQNLALTHDELRTTLGAIPRDDEEGLDVGEHEVLADGEGFVFGKVTKTGASRYEVQIDDNKPFTLTPKDADRIEQADAGLDGATRFDGDYGTFDVYPNQGGQVAVRHLGEDGRPVTVTLDAKSAAAISKAITVVNEGFDEEDTSPNAPDSGVTAKTVDTNHGPVEVRLHGEWGGADSYLTISPTEGDAWGIAIDGPQMDDLASAWRTSALEESRRTPAGGVALVEAKRAAPYGRSGELPSKPLPGLAGIKPRTPMKESVMRETTLAEARNIGGWIESRLHLALTQLGDDMYGQGRLTRDERIALSSAVGGALDAFTAAVQEQAPQLYERDLYDDPDDSADAASVMSEAARALAEAAGITANDLRDALCDAVKDAYGGKDIWTWVRDYTDDWVVFSMENGSGLGGGSDLYQQTYTLAGREVTLTGEPVEVRAVTTYEPEPQTPGEPGDEGTTPTAPGNAPGTAQMEEGAMPEITEEQARQLAEAATMKTQLEEALTHIAQLRERADTADARANAADAKAQRLENENAARHLVTEALKTSGLPSDSHGRVAASVCRDLPLTEAGTLDTDAFGTLIESAITDKKTEIASYLEAAGVGQIRGLGEARHETSAADIDKQLEEAFAGLPGMDDKAAQVAANGRA
ncbi:hypothetical protein GCM10009530_63740 [Microbispora corallina]|uniref:Uncharacterized protein n=1 Tax=Microbispora corallina TaxID=83302 RepID=A0ABQ4GC33_9ACTN|nr:hypothetical protein [Microbispora corallina]GIH44597.1 hypothetical protein Mco01_75970 [Microbispora corallina]